MGPELIPDDGPAELRPVLLGDGSRASAVAAHLGDPPVAGRPPDVGESLAWAARVGGRAPKPGSGRTRLLWEILASAAAADVGLARVLEPHLDAIAILDQARALGAECPAEIPEGSTWGVFAAEGPGVRLSAEPDGGGWTVDGVKPWCSLANELTHALVTAHIADGTRGLFAVDMAERGVHPESGPWVSRGLSQVISAPVRFDHVRAVPVGGPGWYLSRPGFEWGGIGVAACWWGGAVGVARRLYRGLGEREPDQIALAHLGRVDAALESSRMALLHAADAVDDPGRLRDWPVLARRTRNIVVAAAETVLRVASEALGPAPLTTEEAHARRVADLQIYIRQHHGERDEASLGRRLLEGGDAPW